jgi:hypothetical protein
MRRATDLFPFMFMDIVYHDFQIIPTALYPLYWSHHLLLRLGNGRTEVLLVQKPFFVH